jgi:hypothetical protein
MMGDDNPRIPSWVTFVNVLLALWLMVANPLTAWSTGYRTHGLTIANDVIAGLIVLATGFMGVRSQRPGPYWVQFAVGAWLIGAPIFLRFENMNPAFIDMLVGFFVAMGGLIAALWLTPNLRRRLPGV